VLQFRNFAPIFFQSLTIQTGLEENFLWNESNAFAFFVLKYPKKLVPHRVLINAIGHRAYLNKKAE